jgi:hypothetical protein
MRRCQDHARGGCLAARAILRLIAFGHWPHIGERPTGLTKIFVDWHGTPAG